MAFSAPNRLAVSRRSYRKRSRSPPNDRRIPRLTGRYDCASGESATIDAMLIDVQGAFNFIEQRANKTNIVALARLIRIETGIPNRWLPKGVWIDGNEFLLVCLGIHSGQLFDESGVLAAPMQDQDQWHRLASVIALRDVHMINSLDSVDLDVLDRI